MSSQLPSTLSQTGGVDGIPRACDWCSTTTGGSYEAYCSCCQRLRGRVCIDCLPHFEGKPCDGCRLVDGCQPGAPNHTPHARTTAKGPDDERYAQSSRGPGRIAAAPAPYSPAVHDRLLRDLSAIRTLLADPHMAGQVLERLPSGQYAWLRPEQPDDDPRYVPTSLGRRTLAMDAVFGPWPAAVGHDEMEVRS